MTLTRYKLVLQSNLNSISRIEPYVNQIVSDFGINDEIYGNILIALTEAVNNAILHGNKEDKSKKVTIKLVSNNPKNQLVFQISDDGPGFNHNHIPDPTAPENILKLGGRGVFLMRQLSDKIEFMNNGSTVQIRFFL
jgi:serine/threonine-protein kinase RsbW